MKNNNFNESLIKFCLISIPLYAILFSLKKSPFDYTLSMMGNWFDYRLKFVIWGVVTALLLFIAVSSIYKKVKIQNKKARNLLFFSSVFLVLTVITPTIHTEEIYGELSKLKVFLNLHTLFGILFAVFLLSSLFLFSKYLEVIDRELSIRSLRYLFLALLGSLLILIFFGMTGIFELFFFGYLSLFLLVTNKYI